MADGDRFTGNGFLIYIDGTPDVALEGQDSLEYTINGSAIDLSSKDTGGWAVTKPGRRSWSFSASGTFVDSDAGRASLKSSLHAGTVVNVVIVRPDSTTLSGVAVITSYNESGPDESKFAYSIAGTGDGEPTDTELS